jgi:hypothetical protein
MTMWTARLTAALVLSTVVSAQAAPTVFVHPAELLVEPGAEFSMSIRVDAGTDTVTCFLVEFQFDPSVLELISAEEGSLFTECGYGTMYHWEASDSGRHSCNDVTLGHDAYVLCPGELINLEFISVGEGVTLIEILHADLRDIRRDPILPLFTESALVAVIPGTGIPENSGGGNMSLSAVPNPSIGETEFRFRLPGSARAASLSIYDVAGRVVWKFGPIETTYVGNIMWRGCDAGGAPVPSGVYLVEFRADLFHRREVVDRSKIVISR